MSDTITRVARVEIAQRDETPAPTRQEVVFDIRNLTVRYGRATACANRFISRALPGPVVSRPSPSRVAVRAASSRSVIRAVPA